MQGAQQKITDDLTKAADPAGKKAGAAAGESMSKALSKKMTGAGTALSKTLTALSLEKFRRGNVSEAVQDVLQALPSEENRKPYVPEAEDALSQELSLYRDEAFCMERSIHGKSAFSDFCLTSGGKYLVTLESADAMVQAYDNDTGGCLWTTRLPNKQSAWESLQILQSDDILVCGYGQCARISGKDGAILWVRTDGSADAVSEDRKLFLSCMEEGPAEGYTVFPSAGLFHLMGTWR